MRNILMISQTESADDNDVTGDDDADHAGRTVSNDGQDPGEERGTGYEQILLGSGQLFQRNSQKQPSRDTKDSGISARSIKMSRNWRQ